MDHDKAKRWDDLAKKVSRGVAKDFPDLEVDDLYGELWVDIMSQDYRDHLDEPWIRNHLYRRCRVLAWNTRKENLQFSSQYVYRPSDIRAMLRVIFEPADWPKIYLPQDAREEDNQSARLDVAADLSWGLDQLPDHYREILESRYRDGTEMTLDAERKTLGRAETRLTELVNQYRGQYDGSHSRRAISNARANFQIQEQYE